MKRLFLILIAAVIVLMSMGTIVSCSSEPEEAVVLRLAVPWPPGDPVTINIEKFIAKFNEQAEGKYVIELHTGESLVKLFDSMDAVRTGAVEMVGFPTGIFASLDPVFAAAEIPFLANNAEADAEMQIGTLPLYDEVMTEKFNSKPIYSFTCLALDVISTKPIQTAADWKGMLVQSVSPQSGKFIEYMGGAAVPMPFPEGYQGLQKKVIEGSMQSSSMMIMFKLNEVADYVLRGYLIPASLMLAINLDTYDDMPNDIKDLMIKLGKEAQTDTNNFFCNVARENTQTLTDMGITVYSLPKAERDAWAKTVQPYCDELFQNMDADIASKLKKIAEDANAKFPYKE